MPSESSSSPRRRPATPKKPDRLRGGTPSPPVPEVHKSLATVVEGALSNSHESAEPPELHANFDLDDSAPEPSLASETLLSNGRDEPDAATFQPEHVTRFTLPLRDDLHSHNRDRNNPMPNLPSANSSRWRKVREDTAVKETLRRWPGNSPLAGSFLCQACQSLDLSVDKFVIDPNAPRLSKPNFWGKRSMGFLKEIEFRSACSLCRLLKEAATLAQYPATIHTRNIHDAHLGMGDNLEPECYLYWTVDGRERLEEERDGRLRTVKRTRRLCIEWTHKPHERTYIVLVAPEGKFTADGRINNDIYEVSTLYLGRLLTSLQKSSVDLIKSWLQCCRQHHTEKCVVHKDLRARFTDDVRYRSATFTLIDVENMCLTSISDEDGSEAHYVALSYTWGNLTRDNSGGHGAPPKKKNQAAHELGFVTTKENVHLLEEKDGIRTALDKTMPKAIQHAIYLTQMLGYRYLWVDSLCIVQNDPISWELNAEFMDVVYGNAEFTICAADGDSAVDGLKALFPPEDSRYARHAEEFVADYELEGRQRLKLILSRPSEYYIERSRWNKRAWTFQERMLSPRCVIFVAGRIYLQCRTTLMSEDICSEVELAGWSVELAGAPARTLERLNTDPISVYKTCLGMYTRRKLSFEGDILAAFSGIENIILSSLGPNCETIFGLPNSHFDWALLWEPEESPEARDGGRFPTWSWCGWKGKKIVYKAATVEGPEINLHEWLLEHTWITYYIRNGQGNLRLIWDPLRHKSSNEIKERWRGYDSPQTGLPKEGDPLGFPNFDYHGRPFNRQTPRRGRIPKQGEKQFVRMIGAYRRRVAVLKPGSGREETVIRGISRKSRGDERYLQFWTWSAEFHLGEETANDRFSDGSRVGLGLKRFAILDADGDFAGTCILDEYWSEAARSGKAQEFIALSDARDFDVSEYGAWNFYTEEATDLVAWQLYNVMTIWYEEGNPDVAYRGGIGKVYKSAFGHSDEDWKEIVLG